MLLNRLGLLFAVGFAFALCVPHPPIEGLRGSLAFASEAPMALSGEAGGVLIAAFEANRRARADAGVTR